MLESRWLIAGILVVALAVGACGNDEERPGTQPSPQITGFDQGAFDDLPLLPRTEPYGARSEKDGVVTRSYRTTGVQPTDVIDFYERVLPESGWESASPAFRSDTESRADWVMDRWRLEVSATRVEDRRIPSSAQFVAQYSLVLRPR